MNRTLRAAILVSVQAFLIWRLGGNLSPLLLAAILAWGSHWARPLARSRVGQGAFLVLALALPIGLSLLDRSAASMARARLESAGLVFAEIVLLLQSGLLLARNSQSDIPRSFVPLTVLGCLGGMGQSFPIEEHNLILLGASGVTIGFSWVSMAAIDSNRGRRLLIQAGCLVCLGTFGFSTLWGWSLQFAQSWFQEFAGELAGNAGASRVYPQSGQLGDVAYEQSTDPFDLALRVTAREKPGYLRGHVYDTFEEGRWSATTEPIRRRIERESAPFRWITPSSERIRGIPNPPPRHNVFPLAPTSTSERLSELEIANEPDRGLTFFSPLETHVIVARATSIALDDHDVPRDGLTPTFPYKVYFADRKQQRTLDERQRVRLLTPFEEMTYNLPRLARKIVPRRGSTLAKTIAIENYFEQNFVYTVTPEAFPTSQQDRLSYFLEHRPPAHCEFFATAAAGLLRAMGIPCRYVIGYVVDESHDEIDNLWLARNRDAHAWVEAWDDRSRTWLIVEATPGMSANRDETPEQAEPADEGRPAESVEITATAPSRLSVWGTVIFREIHGAVSRAAIPIVVVILLVIGIALVRSRQTPIGDPTVRRRAQTRGRLDRKLAHLGLKRDSGETLHQFAHRIRESLEDEPWRDACARWYEQCAILQFRGASQDDWLRWEAELPALLTRNGTPSST